VVREFGELELGAAGRIAYPDQVSDGAAGSLKGGRSLVVTADIRRM
jgi:hypothetical protein